MLFNYIGIDVYIYEKNGWVVRGGVLLINYVICYMNLDVLFVVENYLIFDILVGFFLRKEGGTRLFRYMCIKKCFYLI